MIAIPAVEGMVRKNAEFLSKDCRLCLVLNGYSSRRARRLVQQLSVHAVVRLPTLPGYPVKHGTAVTLALDHAREDFILLDPDCYVRDVRFLEIPEFSANEYVAAPDHPHFYNRNQMTGERFPRTHFLVVNLALFRALMTRHQVTAEKYVRAPRRLQKALESIGYGSHNYPRSYLRHFDTLLLLMAMARHDELRVRWLPADASQIVHWKHHAAVARGLSAK